MRNKKPVAESGYGLFLLGLEEKLVVILRSKDLE